MLLNEIDIIFFPYLKTRYYVNFLKTNEKNNNRKRRKNGKKKKALPIFGTGFNRVLGDTLNRQSYFKPLENREHNT